MHLGCSSIISSDVWFCFALKNILKTQLQTDWIPNSREDPLNKKRFDVKEIDAPLQTESYWNL